MDRRTGGRTTEAPACKAGDTGGGTRTVLQIMASARCRAASAGPPGRPRGKLHGLVSAEPVSLLAVRLDVWDVAEGLHRDACGSSNAQLGCAVE